MHMCVQCCHILRFLKNNTPSHVRDQYVILIQKGIKIGPVVWPLTRSFAHFLNQSINQSITLLSYPECLKLVASGAVNVKSAITHRLTQDKVKDGMDLIRKGQCIKVVIDCES